MSRMVTVLFLDFNKRKQNILSVFASLLIPLMGSWINKVGEISMLEGKEILLNAIAECCIESRGKGLLSTTIHCKMFMLY